MVEELEKYPLESYNDKRISTIYISARYWELLNIECPWSFDILVTEGTGWQDCSQRKFPGNDFPGTGSRDWSHGFFFVSDRERERANQVARCLLSKLKTFDFWVGRSPENGSFTFLPSKVVTWPIAQ